MTFVLHPRPHADRPWALAARSRRLLQAALLVLLLPPRVALSQLVPSDTAGLNAPSGWQPADQVRPRITVNTSYDPTRALWTYEYTVANDSGAKQSISSIFIDAHLLVAPSPPLVASAPPGWRAAAYPYDGPSTLVPGVTFRASFEDSLGASAPSAAIRPGSALSGFVITSPFPPGVAQVAVQGFVPAISVDDDSDTILPSDRANAQRSVIVFPNQPIVSSDRRPVGSSALPLPSRSGLPVSP